MSTARRLAEIYETSERQIARWEKLDAPLENVKEMETFLFRGRNPAQATLTKIGRERAVMQRQIDALFGQASQVAGMDDAAEREAFNLQFSRERWECRNLEFSDLVEMPLNALKIGTVDFETYVRMTLETFDHVAHSRSRGESRAPNSIPRHIAKL